VIFDVKYQWISNVLWILDVTVGFVTVRGFRYVVREQRQIPALVKVRPEQWQAKRNRLVSY